MSRYINVDTVSFTDKNGKSYAVKEQRNILDELIAFELKITQEDMLDEIASRRTIFGEFGEMQTYRLFDANIVKLTENNFDLSKLKSIKIPIV